MRLFLVAKCPAPKEHPGYSRATNLLEGWRSLPGTLSVISFCETIAGEVEASRCWQRLLRRYLPKLSAFARIPSPPSD